MNLLNIKVKLILDDIVIFKTGNQILADSEIVSGEVLVNESLLTGESDEILKTIFLIFFHLFIRKPIVCIRGYPIYVNFFVT